MDIKPLHRILIVDDEKADLDALTQILKFRYAVYVAKSGQAAFRKVREVNPDLILLDILMPDINGFEILSKLKESGVTRDIPVILITALNKVEDEEKGFSLGAVDYIKKPFHGAIVKARIKSHLHIAEQFRVKDNAAVIIKTRHEIRKVLYRELIYIEVSGHWLNFYVANGEKLTVYATLKEYEDILCSDPRFACCHRSFIINMDFVAVMEAHNVLLRNDIRLPISKGNADVKKKYIDWIHGDMEEL